MAEFIKLVGMRSTMVWLDRVVARLPNTAGREIIRTFAKGLVNRIRIYSQQGAIYHSEKPGMLGKSFAYHFQGPYQIVIDSTHPGAEAANYGMTKLLIGKKRVRLPGGKWRVSKKGGVMTKSRALNFVEYAVVDETKRMDGIIESNMKKRGFT